MKRIDFVKMLTLTAFIPAAVKADDKIYNKTILEFGAKGDGKTDDTDAFKKALLNSDHLQLPSGKTFVLSNLELEGKTISGPGRLAKKIGSHSCLVLKGKNNRLSGIEFVTKGAGTRPESEILLSDGVEFSIIENCHFNGLSFTCISSGLNSDNDKIYKDLVLRKKVILNKNLFSGQYVHHLYLHALEDLTIAENYFEKSHFDSIRLRQLVKRCVISGNFFSKIGLSKVKDSRDAIDCFWSGNELSITNNHFNDIAVHALDVKGHSPDLDYGTSRVLITGNQIRNAGHDGILISAGAKTKKGWKAIQNIIISNNFIEGCGYDTVNPNDAAILLRHCQENIQIHSNQIIKNLNKGIMVGNFEPGAGITRNVSIQSNMILNNGRPNQKESYGIHISGGENILVAQNIIENNTKDTNAYQMKSIVAHKYKDYELTNYTSVNNMIHGHLSKEN